MIMQHSGFQSADGISEHFFACSGASGGDFRNEAIALLKEYEQGIARYGCSVDTELLLRFHLSDVTNQGVILRELLAGRNSYISIVGQPPASGRIAVESWHWCGGEKSAVPRGISWNLKHYRAFWHGGPPEKSGSYDQTMEAFEKLQLDLSERGASVADNTVRTWLYCRDVDNNYSGLVKARNDFFDGVGLNPSTHFIASTGIEGQMENPAGLVSMEAFSILGLTAGQQQYLAALDYLSPTSLYGVSFERATRLVWGDRSHYYISGTASIDRDGKVLYPGDVASQTRRMLTNVEALLAEGDGNMTDLKIATVYLRDSADAGLVTAVIEEALPAGIPLTVVRAPVCRPAWLVEMEAVAVNSRGNRSYRPLA